MKWQDHITVDPLGCYAMPCIRGTRVMVSVTLDNLAAGADPCTTRLDERENTQVSRDVAGRSWI